MMNSFNTLIVITPVDCQRLLPLYKRLTENIDYGPIIFVGTREVGQLVGAAADLSDKCLQ